MALIPNGHKIPVLGKSFSPKDIAGLRLWLKADAGIFTDDAATTPAVADGNVIAVWQDQSGNGYHVTQTDNTKRPLLKLGANGINGKPTILFDGSNDLMFRTVANWLSTDSTGSMFFVYRMTNPLQVNGTLISSNDTASVLYVVVIKGVGDTGINSVHIFQSSNDVPDSVKDSTVIASNTNYLLEVHSSGTAYTSSINGTVQTLSVLGGANTGDWFADTSNRDVFAIGSSKHTSEAALLKGSIAEILVYGGVLSTANINSIKRYLGNRYGIVAFP